MKKGVGQIASAICFAVLALILSGILSSMQEDWTSYIDETDRAVMDILEILIPVFWIGAAIDFIVGIIMLAVGDSSQQQPPQYPNYTNQQQPPQYPNYPNQPPQYPNYMSQPQAPRKEMTLCIFCDKPTEKGLPYCSHCGRRQD